MKAEDFISQLKNHRWHEIIEKISPVINTLLSSVIEYQDVIKRIGKKYVYNVGKSGLIGATYIQYKLQNK